MAALVPGDGVVLDATLMVLDARGRPSADAAPAPPARGGTVKHGAAAAAGRRRSARWLGPGAAALVASDLLYLDGRSLAGRPFGERRGELAALLAAVALVPAPAAGSSATGTTVAEALGALGFRALSARRLDAPLRAGPAGDAWYRVPVVAAPRELPPLLAVFRRLPL